MNRVVALALFACAAILAACNSSTPSTTPTPGPTCQLPTGTQTALVYPAPNATAVVDNNGQIIIGSSPALPVGQSGQNWGIAIVDAVNPGGAFLPGPMQTASPPFPTPNATPSFPNPVYQTESAGVPFGANQVVKVYVNNSATNCSPLFIGQFNT